jgi:DnaJ-class molecular chaperone
MSEAEPKLLLCQECRGYGKKVAEIILGAYRYEVCGWCQGSGEITPELRGVWLRYMREMKYQARRHV